MPEPKKGQRFSEECRAAAADVKAFIDEWPTEPKPGGVAHELPGTGFVHVQLRLLPDQMKRILAGMRVAEIRTALTGRPKYRPPNVPPDLPDLVRRFNIDAAAKNADSMVTVGELRAALAALPDDVYVVLPDDDDGDTPLAVDRDDRVELAPVWYNPTDCTWAGDSYLIDQSCEDPDDRYQPEPGRDVVAIRLSGVH